MRGIDVSNHNGDINWNEVKAFGIECVYIKASEGTTFVDGSLSTNYNGAKSVGLSTGFYHFLVGSSEPETQAENFYNCIKDKENNLIPCLDLEHSSNEPNNFMDFALRFIERFKALSHMNVAIYACPSFINENLDSRLSSYPLWCAHYGVDRPGFNRVWGSSYSGHQYSENGSVSGICGYVDMNNFEESILNGGQAVASNTTTALPYQNKFAVLQRELNNQGFTDKNGNPLKADGIPGELTLSACPLVKPGARGNITRWIQEQINVSADGDFGPVTQEGVRNYQEAHNLSVDGIVGQETWKSLLNL